MGKRKILIKNVVDTKYQSLLEILDIPIENISYEYITKCTCSREIENILQVLRSGEEGFYPDLIEFTEKKLSSIKPDSFLLQYEKPVIFKNMLPLKECETIESDLDNWVSEIKMKEKDLQKENNILNDNINSLLPSIRNINIPKQNNIESMKNEKKYKNITTCDYAAWHKYDADTELNRIDIQDQQNQIKMKRAQQEKKDREERQKKLLEEEIKNKNSLTDSELHTMAEIERTKGNEAFKLGDYKQALQFYNYSIELNGNITAYNNRAITYIKLKNFKSAYDDCCRVLREEPNNIKALYRRATALENMNDKEKASTDFKSILKLEPNNREALRAIQRLDSKLPKQTNRIGMYVNVQKELFKQQQSQVGLPISYYSNLSYVDVTKYCYCFALPTSSHYIYPIPHLRNVHCIIGDKIQAKRKTNKVKNKINININKTKFIGSDVQNNHIINQSDDNKNNNNEFDVPLQNNLNEKQFTSKVREKNSLNEDSEFEKKNNKKLININGTKDFKEQPILNDVQDESTSAENIKNKISELKSNKIKSPYEFLCLWQTVKKDSTLSQHAQILRSIDPENFITVVGNNMDSDMWSIIIGCLVNNFLRVDDVDLIVKYLDSFWMVDRFIITLMFMSSDDKKGLGQIFDFVQKHSPGKLKGIRAKYEI